MNIRERGLFKDIYGREPHDQFELDKFMQTVRVEPNQKPGEAPDSEPGTDWEALLSWMIGALVVLILLWIEWRIRILEVQTDLIRDAIETYFKKGE
jgi:hypothetical protein